MKIEESRLQKEKEAQAKAEAAEFAKAKTEAQNKLTEAEKRVSDQVLTVEYYTSQYNNPEAFSLTADDKP
jgi:hypothetical protein